MSTEKKITKREKYEMLLPLVADNPMLTEFVEHEIELLANKKTSAKPTAQQQANEKIAEIVLDILADEGRKKVNELIKHPAVLAFDPKMTSQRMTHIVTAMFKADKILRVTEKKDTFFKAIEVED